MKNTIFLTTTMLLLCVTASAFAASPVLFFSDLTDGPKTGWEGSAAKGAAVTIWGKNFGSSRGTGYVTVGGVNLTNDSDYAEWGATANNARGLERVTFYLNSNCANGAETISVTVGGVTSNALSFYVRTSGNIRFVDHTNGSNSYNGQYTAHGSGSNGPWQTLPYARAQLSNSDILYVRSGTYTEADSYNSNLFVNGATAGTANAMTAFVGYPGEWPILDHHIIGTGYPCIRNNGQYEGDAHHIVFSKMICYPTGGAVGVGASLGGYFRIVNIIATGQYQSGSTWSGCINTMNESHIKILGCIISNWGIDKFDHAVYWSCDSNNPNLITTDLEAGWNEIHDLGPETSGIYSHPVDSGGTGYADEVYIHDNLVYNLSHAGIFISSRHQNVYIYNNIVRNCGSTAYGRCSVYIACHQTPTSNVRLHNNTIYAITGDRAIGYGGGGVDTYDNVTAKNNIIYTTSGTSYVGIDSLEHGTQTSDYDLYYGNGASPGWATHALNSDPQLFNIATYDFHLKDTSPAKDAGTSAVSAIVTRDYDGVARPQSTGFDIGGYEYAIDSAPPVAGTDLGASSVTSTTVFLGRTTPGNDGNIGQTASYDIRHNTSTIADANRDFATQTTDVATLRQFANGYLSGHKWGREFIKFYNRHSPPIAKYIEKRDWAKKIVRVMLKLAVWIARKVNK
jgi:hypothetical protein